ncbi:MAG: 16S rRNA (uracil(1498)-N(3))-methyltransferase [Deltaproteobacteria bacterium]|nr:16S rRNA (uracil(1498)-N(3))-methyltransferase [Deltaproteobacteria bacterium]
MSVFRVFVDFSTNLNRTNNKVTLGEEDSHHIKNVLRSKPGELLEVVDTTCGEVYLSTVSSSSIPLELDLGEKLARTAKSSRIRSITVASIKGQKNDLIVEKATELDAKEIILWNADRSVGVIKAEQIDKKHKRYLAIAESAAKQCKRNYIPEITIVSKTEDLLKHLSTISNTEDLFLLGSTDRDAPPARNLEAPLNDVHLIIGPEGDFSAEELNKLTQFGFIPVSFAPNILRSETAVMAALTTVHAVWDYKKD